MDGLPTELIKLCRLASMAECGDHFWAAVPALGLWSGLWMPFARRWMRSFAATSGSAENGHSKSAQASA
jgi:hypothetical protein